MFNFGSIFEQAAELLHSSNVAELMGEEAPCDLQETMTQFGITPEDLQGLAPEEAMTLLEDRGIDLASLGEGVGLEQINAFIGR